MPKMFILNVKNVKKVKFRLTFLLKVGWNLFRFLLHFCSHLPKWHNSYALLCFIFFTLLYATKNENENEKKGIFSRKKWEGNLWALIGGLYETLFPDWLRNIFRKCGTSLLPLLLLFSTSFPDHALHWKEDRLFTHK
jgi:hypothetical protein